MIPESRGRGYDIAGAVVLGVIGLSIVSASAHNAQSYSYPGDPYYDPGKDPTAGYIAGGIVAGTGAALLIYSLTSLPKQPAPQVQHTAREWTEMKLVEATGCGLPGDPTYTAPVSQPAPLPGPPVAQPQPQPRPGANDTVERLRKLDQLKASGAITDAEYQHKRKEILDGI